MKLIEILRKSYADFAARGLRASTWKLDKSAIAQLRSEAAEAGSDVVSITTPPTFLGVPIEEVPMNDNFQADYVVRHCRFAPCQRLDREHDRQWDIFDLDAGAPQGAFFRTRDEAERAGLALDLGASSPPGNHH